MTSRAESGAPRPATRGAGTRGIAARTTGADPGGTGAVPGARGTAPVRSGPAGRNGTAAARRKPPGTPTAAAPDPRAAARETAADGSRGAGNAPAVARRRNDAQASRAALVKAAAELFDARGYEGATIREIGDRAGVDTALIARYFGGKEGLYLAALAQTPGPVQAGGDPDSVVAGLLEGTGQRPHRPMALAMVSPTLTDSLRARVGPLVESRLTVPLTEWLRDAGTPDPQLRAELLVGVAVGISLTRAGGTLPALSAAGPEEIRALLDPLIDEVRRPGAGR